MQFIFIFNNNNNNNNKKKKVTDRNNNNVLMGQRPPKLARKKTWSHGPSKPNQPGPLAGPTENHRFNPKETKKI